MIYDLIVIGGGVNGCGIARDAAMRGLKTLLIEKNDFGSGTTGASSQMIHGGARYLLSSLKTTKTSSIDSGYIQKIAPHLLFRIPFLFPVLKEPPKAEWARRLHLMLLTVYFSAYDRYSKLKNGMPHARLTPQEALQIEPELNPNLLGAVTFDEWGIDSFRLCIANALSAQEHGCVVKNHTQVEAFIKEGNRVIGVKARDLIRGAEEEFKAKLVMNAAGPWTPKIAALAGCDVPLRPAKGIHVTFDRRLTHYALMANAIDGRNIFIMPYQNVMIMGTTDDDYFGDPDDIPILEDEVQYLLDGISQVFPRVRDSRMIRAWAGVRPTLAGRGPYEDDLSREHQIFDHSLSEGVAGFLSIAGGKLASYRLMSEEAVDLIMKKLNRVGVCRTHSEALPGGEEKLDPAQVAHEYKISTIAAERLIYRHGFRAHRVLEILRERATYRNTLCACEPVLEAEMRYVIRHEMARTLDDLRRRTRYSVGPCQGTRCFAWGAQLIGEELRWSSSETLDHLNAFMEKRWNEKTPILVGSQTAQEELCAAIHYQTGCMDLR